MNSESPFANRSRVGSRICLRNARLCLVSSEKSIGIRSWVASFAIFRRRRHFKRHRPGKGGIRSKVESSAKPLGRLESG